MLNVQRIPVGMGQANCYIISNEKEALIIDPGADAGRIQKAITKLAVQPIAILLTHTHYDHIGAVDEIRKAYEIPVYVAPEENDWLPDPSKNLSQMVGMPVSAGKADHLFSPDETLEIGDFTFKVLATPGHSPGGVSFVFDESEFIISGDALFAGGVGRTDLPGSEPAKLLVGIREQLFTLPGNYTVYSGHGAESTIQKEINTNPFFR